MHFAESITNTMHSKGFLRGMFKLPADPNLKASREHMSLMPKRLELTMNAELKQAVYSAETHLGDDISGTDTEVLEFERYGKTMITSAEMGFSPDAFVQVCMISSYYKLYGEGPNTYEPVQTKTFLHGRTAAMRSLSMHIIEVSGPASRGVHTRSVARKLCLRDHLPSAPLPYHLCHFLCSGSVFALIE